MSETEISKKESTPMTLSNGVYSLETVEDQMKYAAFLISKKLVSDTFKEPAQLMVAIQLCKDLSLPNSCLKDFYVLLGKPVIFGDTFVALALGSPLMGEYKIEFYDEKGELCNIPIKGKKAFSCVVTGRRKNSSVDSVISYSFDDHEISGNKNDNFRKYPRDMLFRRSAGRFIKWLFADAVRGIEMADYAEDVAYRTPVQDVLEAAKEDQQRMLDEQTPPEELREGPLYRIQRGKWRNKQLWQIPIVDIQEYREALEVRARKDRKPWENELFNILNAYVENVDNYREMILELNDKDMTNEK